MAVLIVIYIYIYILLLLLLLLLLLFFFFFFFIFTIGIINNFIYIINLYFIYIYYFIVVELGFCSLYEFIYSFRKNETSPFPEITSNEAVKALEKIKEIMKKLSSGLYNL